MKAFQFYLSAEAVEKTIAILTEAQEHEIAHRIARQFESEKASRAAIQAEQEAEAERRAQRAQYAELTRRQAECLAAVRAGKGPYNVPWSWKNGDETRWAWRHTRNMGGAVRRMVDSLIEEGLLTDRRELTPGGLTRLELWEAMNGGRVGP